MPLDPIKRKSAQARYRHKYRDLIRIRNTQYREDNPDVAHGWDLKKFGITSVDYQEMWNAQGGVCAIPGCGGTSGIHGRRMCVDHDHKTGKIRGLLCGHCNLILGHAKDNPDILKAASEWLRSKL